MRNIKIEKIISVSKQDKLNTVEGIINNESNFSTKKWLSSPYGRTRKMDVEFQLETAAIIRRIEIGNYGSCTIEILARNTSWPDEKQYMTLLPTAILRTFENTKSNTNFNDVTTFTEEDFVKTASNRKYNQIRVICGQPYMDPLQYGLSFINFKTDDFPLQYSVDDFYSGQSIPPVLERIAKFNSSPEAKAYSSRGKQLVDAALNHSGNSKINSSSSTSTSDETENDAICDFTLKVTLFLTDPYVSKYPEVSLDECMKCFESCHQVMNIAEKLEFEIMCKSLFSEDFVNTNENSVSSSSVVTPEKSLRSDPSVSNRKRSRHMASGKSRLSDVHSTENLEECSFDVDITPKKRTRSQTHDSKVTSSSQSSSAAIITLSDDEGPSASSSYRAEDFIQSDGSIPSTSRDFSLKECPICSKEFSTSDIESHAASCVDYKPRIIDDEDSDDDEPPALSNQKLYYMQRYGAKC